MTIAIRDLLARVAMHRPDLNEAEVLWALQETARDVAKYSGICVQRQVPIVLPAMTSAYTIAPADTSQTEIRVKQLRLGAIPRNLAITDGNQCLGTWDASSNIPSIASGSASSSNLYEFYIVTVAGTTAVDAETTWSVGDVIYSTGTAWKKLRLEEYRTSHETNSISINSSVQTPQSATGFPVHFAQDNGVIYFYQPPTHDLPMELTITVCPSRNQLVDDTVPWQFPMEVEDSLIYGAMEMLLRLPGANQSLAQADMWRIRYLKERANVKSVAMLGNGDSWYQPGNFSGRQGRMSPFNSNNGWL